MKKNIVFGFGWGVLATMGMSIVMVLGILYGLSPMPSPFPLAILEKMFGTATSRPLLIALAILAHLGYGGIWGAVLQYLSPYASLLKGILLGIALWIIMQLIVLPLLGWGIFGINITPKIAVATLILHLVYGTILGWGLSPSVNAQRHSLI